MALIGEAEIAIRPIARGFGAAVTSDVKKETETAGKATGTTLGGSMLGSFKENFSGAALTGFLAGSVAFALPQLFSKLKSALSSTVVAFNQTEEANVKLRSSLESNPGAANVSIAAYDKLSAHLQQLQGFQDEQYKTAVGTLAQFGLTGDQVKQLLPLLGDYAAKTGQDIPTSAISLGRALLGNTRGLKTIGIQYKATGNEATDFANITQLVQQRIGGFASKQLATLPGELRLLSADMQDLKSRIGAGVVPVLQSLAGGLDQAIKGTGKLGAVTHASSSAFGQILRSTPGVGVIVTALAGAYDKMGESARKAGQQAIINTAAQDKATHTFGLLFNQMQNGITTQRQFRTAIGQAADQAKRQGADEQTVQGILKQGRTVLSDYRQQVEGLKTAHQQAASAARAQFDAELSLSGGFLGVQGAVLSAKDAEHTLAQATDTVNKLQKQGKTHTTAYAQAVFAQKQAALGAAQGQQALAGASEQYIESLIKNKGLVTQEQVVAQVRQFGKQAGLTQGEIKQLTGSVLAHVRSLHQLEQTGPVKNPVSTPGADASTKQVKGLNTQLAHVPRDVQSKVHVTLQGQEVLHSLRTTLDALSKGVIVPITSVFNTVGDAPTPNRYHRRTGGNG